MVEEKRLLKAVLQYCEDEEASLEETSKYEYARPQATVIVTAS